MSTYRSFEIYVFLLSSASTKRLSEIKRPKYIVLSARFIPWVFALLVHNLFQNGYKEYVLVTKIRESFCCTHLQIIT